MQITIDERYRLESLGYIIVYDYVMREGKAATIIERLDPEAKDALLRSPYGKGIELPEEKACVVGYDAYGEKQTVDTVDVNVISGNPTNELKKYLQTIIHALKRDEKVFLESYGSEEEFTVAANIYRGKYKLVKLSYNFADETTARCSAVWEEAERIDVAPPTHNFMEDAE